MKFWNSCSGKWKKEPTTDRKIRLIMRVEDPAEVGKHASVLEPVSLDMQFPQMGLQ